MLEIRPVCENCDRILPNDSGEAMIYTFECAFYRECIEIFSSTSAELQWWPRTVAFVTKNG